jgi:hypothetical protein
MMTEGRQAKKLPALYETQKFIAEFTKDSQWTLPEAHKSCPHFHTIA